MSDKHNVTPIPIPIARLAVHIMRRGGQSAPPNTPNTPPVLTAGPLSITDTSIESFGTRTPTQVSGMLTQIPGTPTPTSVPQSLAFRSAFTRRVVTRNTVPGSSLYKKDCGGKVAPPNTPATSPEVKAVDRDKSIGGIEGRALGDIEGRTLGDIEGRTFGDDEGNAAGGEKDDAAEDQSVETVKGSSVGSERGGIAGVETVEKGDIVDGDTRGTVSLEGSGATGSKEEDTAKTDFLTDHLNVSNGIYGGETQKPEN